VIFGCQAPDTGNAEIIAHYGTPRQKERYLRPLLDGEVFSCYSMTEPEGGRSLPRPGSGRTRAGRPAGRLPRPHPWTPDRSGG
jgi:alkylation response protein AidB-like acyl-CoA dehydrogenase